MISICACIPLSIALFSFPVKKKKKKNKEFYTPFHSVWSVRYQGKKRKEKKRSQEKNVHIITLMI
jgi:hypothetical protein